MKTLDDPFANRQLNAGAIVSVHAMQAFKDTKNLIVVLRFNSDSVVSNRNHLAVRSGFNIDVNRRRLLTPVLDAVFDQVLKQLNALAGGICYVW